VLTAQEREDAMKEQQIIDSITELKGNLDDKRQFLILQLVTENSGEFPQKRDCILDILTGKWPTVGGTPKPFKPQKRIKIVDLLNSLNKEFDDRMQFLILQVLVEPSQFDKFAKRRDDILNILSRKRPTTNTPSS
jgi:hypothetical protein